MSSTGATTGGRINSLIGPDGKEIDLSETERNMKGPFSPQDIVRKYLHDNATSKDITKIKSAAIDEAKNSIDLALSHLKVLLFV